MSVTREEVEAIATLARLRLEPDEAARLAAELSGILDHMDVLRSAGTADVPPFAIAADDVAAPRADSPGTDALHVRLPAVAPAWRDGFFTVPRLAAQRGPEGGA